MKVVRDWVHRAKICENLSCHIASSSNDWIASGGLRCFLYLKYTQPDWKFTLGMESLVCYTSVVCTQTKIAPPLPLDVMEKMGELNAWEAAIKAQSCSRYSGCMSTKHPHCLSNCLIQSKHNLLSKSLQLKCIKLVEGHLHSKDVLPYETLCWNMGLTHFCFSCLQTLFTFFVLPTKSTHKSFSPWPWNLSLPAFQTPGHKEMWSASVGTKALRAQPWYTSGETAHPSWGKRISSRRLESKASHFILQWEVATSLNLF